MAASYSAHVAARAATTARALEETGFDRLLVHSGMPFTYFADDNDAPFHSTPHFTHWAPVDGPHHLLDVVPGKRPRLGRVPTGESMRSRRRRRSPRPRTAPPRPRSATAPPRSRSTTPTSPRSATSRRRFLIRRSSGSPTMPPRSTTTESAGGRPETPASS